MSFWENADWNQLIQLSTVATAQAALALAFQLVQRLGDDGQLAPEIVNRAFTALIFGLAAAGAMAFGLGGRDAAAAAIAGWRGRRESGVSQ